jgi:hypothetical protein
MSSSLASEFDLERIRNTGTEKNAHCQRAESNLQDLVAEYQQYQEASLDNEEYIEGEGEGEGEYAAEEEHLEVCSFGFL